MMSEPRHYRVELVGQAGHHLELLTTVAEQRGLRELLKEVLNEILIHLETHPFEWGDPYTNYRGLNAVYLISAPAAIEALGGGDCRTSGVSG